MRDFHATLKIQHGPLRHAMRELGIKSVLQLARKCNASASEIGLFLNFKKSPRTKDGAWRKCALKVCAAVGIEPSELFPEHLQRELPTNRIEAFVEQRQLSFAAAPMLGPGEMMDREERTAVLNAVLETLPPRSQRVIKARFWEGKTLREVGKEIGVTPECVRMIEAKALRMLSHPSRSRGLAEWVDVR